MTEKIKPILRYLAFLLTLTVLMFSLSLNVVKAADRNQTAVGSQTTDGTRQRPEIKQLTGTRQLMGPGRQTGIKLQTETRLQTENAPHLMRHTRTFAMSGREKSGRTICSGASTLRTGQSDLCTQMSLQRKTAF